ncbi:hypothetical protein PM082_004366 [Marasmius tenuissimus]|nr:hypothetical protein PM082_004366 [Marasmius tenuissimus]
MSVSIPKLFGPVLIGALVGAILYGVTSVQTYFYYKNYSNDIKRLQYLVAIIWILDTAHVSLASICVYHYLVSSLDNQSALKRIHWSLTLSVLLNVHPNPQQQKSQVTLSNRCTPVRALPQAYFPGSQAGPVLSYAAARTGTTTRRDPMDLDSLPRHFSGASLWFVPCFLFPLRRLCFTSSRPIETIVWLFVKNTFQGFQTSKIIKVASATPFTLSSVLSDVFIAGSLCSILHEGRSGIHKRTNTLVTTLIVYAVNRCILTSVVVIAEVAVFAARPDELWFLGIDFVIGKLYANSLLASLNSRNALRNQESNTTSHPSLHLSADIPCSSKLTTGTV